MIYGPVFRGLLGQGVKKHVQRANRAKDRLRLITALQTRRAFLKRARAAVSDNLVQGTMLGLDSSAFRGTQASIQTQKEFAIFEADQQEELNKKIAMETQRAQDEMDRTERAGMIGDIMDEIINKASGPGF